ncbi:unnamed protein product [Ilex paraguariensis]|uniref:Uncharacterized protein n=1 Tax=Ilex paraguariensis TaxID=185542 RepID=A0ABC8TJL3_9AQUA
MGFFVQKLNFQPTRISRRPNILLLSLEKRIIPRCSVWLLLMSGDLIKGDVNLTTAIAMKEKNFLENFVIKYQHMVPEVVNAYRVREKVYVQESNYATTDLKISDLGAYESSLSNPNLLLLRLEKRIAPRCSLFRFATCDVEGADQGKCKLTYAFR